MRGTVASGCPFQPVGVNSCGLELANFFVIEVQAHQADMIDALLTAFVASTAEQGRSAKRNLRVAIISAVLALVAVVATVL